MHLGRTVVAALKGATIGIIGLCVGPIGLVSGQTPHEVRSQTLDRKAFVERIENALAAGDRAYVAAQIHYPLTVSMSGFRMPFTTPAEVLERYDDIFTTGLRSQLEQHVTIAVIDGHHRITAVTVPRPEPAEHASTATLKPIAREPRRIAVRAGPRPTQFAGSLAGGGTDAYVLFVPKGQLVQIRVERGGGEAVLDVVHATSGARISPNTPKTAISIAGRAPESGDYRISVRHVGHPDAAPLPYMLSVSTR